MKTETFNLSKDILALLEKNGITIATPIQKEIIPAVLAGRDVLAQSETGSGKTISFAIPIIERTQSKDGLDALVLVPTRELCTQVTEEFIKFSMGKRLGITAVYGGVSIDNQIRKLKKTNIVIATPGRLIDLIDRRAVHLDKIKFLVFDEADRMLDMGFIKDIEKILKHVPNELQTMLFSATISKEITQLSKKYLYNPVQVILESEIKPEYLQQTYYRTTTNEKLPLLIHLLKDERDISIIFCNRKHITSKLVAKLNKFGIRAKCLHGDMSQSQRERVTTEFKHKRFNILIATDVASRGLHIEDISHVYNYEIPKDVDSYTHRVGRTARAGKKGDAISLVTNGEDQKFFKQILFNYNGNITLKTVNPAELPIIEQQPKEKKEKRTKKEQPKVLKEKKTFRGKKSKEQSNHNTKRPFTEKKRKEEDFIVIEDQPKFDKFNHKIWSGDKSEPIVPETTYPYHRSKPKFWDKNKKKFFGKKRPETRTETKPLVWRENTGDPMDRSYPKPFGENKFGKKKNPKFFKKKKSNSWEDRKPKFWNEGKPNSRLNQK